ncbi:hypothetical protein RND81_11G049300 [Saponaria officinalis]|uniref:Uncharacterized protein n=1 Tax=Saponaria officinalis TaxID=3572 RepID=A0AAW1HHY1_SAPOF
MYSVSVMAFLERRVRLPQHTYLQYSITNLLAAVIIAFTLFRLEVLHLACQILYRSDLLRLLILVGLLPSSTILRVW